jgi:hypothetical protein
VTKHEVIDPAAFPSLAGLPLNQLRADRFGAVAAGAGLEERA